MIEISRKLADDFLSVLLKSTVSSRRNMADISLRTGADGLRLRAVGDEVAVEYRQDGAGDEEEVRLPGRSFRDFSGRGRSPVRLERDSTYVVARWENNGKAMDKSYVQASKRGRDWPPAPEKTAEFPPSFLRCLRDATNAAGRQMYRTYNTDRVLFDGEAGRLVATDGQRLLIQGKFAFPFQEKLLVPRIDVFGSKALPDNEPVRVGRTDRFLTVSVGPWTFHLTIVEGRFPDVDPVIPKEQPGTVLSLAPPDRDHLLQELPRRPAEAGKATALTFDLAPERAVVRFSADGDEASVTEVVLAKSHVTGKPVCLAAKTNNVRLALELGFDKFEIVSAKDHPTCRDAARLYVMVNLGEDFVAAKKS